MLNSKQRAYLRGLANNLDAVLRVGKEGVSPEFTKSADEALEAREIVKFGVLENCGLTAAEAAQTLAGRTRSDVVAVVGRKFTLYRKSVVKPIIELPRK